jgi:hypothetical protein
MNDDINNESNVLNTQIRDVMVYAYSARIKRRAQLEVKKGINIYKISQLPGSLYKDSIKAKIFGIQEAIIRNISIKEHFEKNIIKEDLKKYKKELKEVIRELDNINKELERLNNEIIYQSQVPISPNPEIYKDKVMPVSLNSDNWRAYLDFLKSSLKENRQKARDLMLKKLDIKLKIKQLEDNIKQVSSYLTYKSYDVEITLDSDIDDASGEIEISYIMPGASWFPVYDLRILPEDNKLSITTYGILRQQTGEDWENVSLSFSTASPHFSTDIVELNSWRIKQTDTDIIQMNKRSMEDMDDDREEESAEFKLKREMKDKKRKKSERTRKPGMISASKITDEIDDILSDEVVEEKKEMFSAGDEPLTKSQSSFSGRHYTKLTKSQSSFSGGKHKRGLDKRTGRADKQTDLANYKRKLESFYFDDFSYDDIIAKSVNHMISEKANKYTNKMIDIKQASGGYDYRYNALSLENIPSRDEFTKVTLNLHTQEIELSYQTIPLEIPKVYLKALYKNEDEAPLLSGSAKIFIENDFIGESFINTISPGELASFSLGIDDDIKVIRREKNKREKSGLFSKNMVIKFDNEIEIKNYKNEEVLVEILDRIPKSGQQDDISIYDENYSHQPNHKSSRGIIKWKINLKPEQQELIKFNYKIKHPENFQLISNEENTAYKEGEY